MNRRVVPLGGLLLLMTGCFGEDTSSLLVSPSPFGPQARPVRPTQVAHAPATEEVAKRVGAVGLKVVTANPQMALRPQFISIGSPQLEIFHQTTGASFESTQIWITEGLVRQCRTEAQLAAVLAMELGKLVSEREAMVPASTRLPDRRPPPDVPVGTDSRGAFGSPDGTRYVELAKLDKQRVRPHTPPPPPPAPEVLARAYLTRAGYAAGDLDDVTPLLRQAEDHSALEEQLNKPIPGGLPPAR
jgi:hypothetical protein